MYEHLSQNIPPEHAERINSDFQILTRKIKEKYGVEINSPYEVFCNPAPLNIVYTTREFQPSGEMFDQTYKFVETSIAPMEPQRSFDFSVLKGKIVQTAKELQYISVVLSVL